MGVDAGDKAKLEKNIELLTRCIRGRFQVWAGVVDGENAKADPCALCVEYLDAKCDGCPVAEDDPSAGTPYSDREQVCGAELTFPGGPRPAFITCADAAAKGVDLVELREKLLVRLCAADVGKAEEGGS